MSEKEKITDKKTTICVVDIDDQGLSKYFFCKYYIIGTDPYPVSH